MPDPAYAVGQFRDPVAERARLQAQAEVIARAEDEALAALGFPHTGRGLDIGCGPGYAAAKLRRSRPALQLFGADRDRTQLGGALPAACADARALPFAGGSFDFALARLVLRHLPDPRAALVEARRVLRPGGLMVALDTDDGTLALHPLPAHFAPVLAARQRTFQRRGADPHIGRRLVPLLRAAGFRDVTAAPLPVLSSAIGRQAFAAIVLGPIADAIDPDLMAPADVTAGAAAIAAWADEPEAFGMITPLVVAGRR